MRIRLLQHKDPEKRGSEKAYKFFNHIFAMQTVWIPKSVIKHISRDPFPDQEDMLMCSIEVEDWFAEKNNL